MKFPVWAIPLYVFFVVGAALVGLSLVGGTTPSGFPLPDPLIIVQELFMLFWSSWLVRFCVALAGSLLITVVLIDASRSVYAWFRKR